MIGSHDSGSRHHCLPACEALQSSIDQREISNDCISAVVVTLCRTGSNSATAKFKAVNLSLILCKGSYLPITNRTSNTVPSWARSREEWVLSRQHLVLLMRSHSWTGWRYAGWIINDSVRCRLFPINSQSFSIGRQVNQWVNGFLPGRRLRYDSRQILSKARHHGRWPARVGLMSIHSSSSQMIQPRP